MGGKGRSPGLGGRGRGRERSGTEEGRALGWRERLESEDGGGWGGQRRGHLRGRRGGKGGNGGRGDGRELFRTRARGGGT